MFKSPVLNDLEASGFIKDIAKKEKLDAILASSKITLYCGFDLTAKSLHVGNLMQIMFARKFLKYGHRVIFLLGGGTTKVGDPTGKDESRKVLSDLEIEENKKGIAANFGQFIDTSSPNVLMLNNLDWLSKFSYIDFLREVGSHFTVNRMLAMESVRTRLEKQSPMNFVEFNYMLMQGYDFAYLNKNYDCILQIGGSDQWGNITEGMELCHRMNGREGFALTSPLITRADGQKMGKSANGAVFLSSELTSSYEYFQYFRNVPDEDVVKMLKIYTDLPLGEIEELSKLKGKDINKTKEILAFEVTKLCRGEAEAKEAKAEANRIFTEGKAPESEDHTLAAKPGDNILKVLLEGGAISSMTEGRRLLEAKSIRIEKNMGFDIIWEEVVNQDRISYTFQKVGECKVYIGKKKVYKIKVL